MKEMFTGWRTGKLYWNKSKLSPITWFFLIAEKCGFLRFENFFVS
jgi:hypothetical protein